MRVQPVKSTSVNVEPPVHSKIKTQNKTLLNDYSKRNLVRTVDQLAFILNLNTDL